MKVTSATKTIEELRTILACWGLLKQIITDNGPQFTYEEFQKFMHSNGLGTLEQLHIIPNPMGLQNGLSKPSKQAMKN